MIKPAINSKLNLVQIEATNAKHSFGVRDVPPAAAVWDHLPPHCVFVRWVQQLRRAVHESRFPKQCSSAEVLSQGLEGEAPGANVWDVIGHGVVIEHTDLDESAALLPLVAEAAGMDYWEIAGDQVVSSFNDWKQLLSETTPTLVHLQAGQWVSDGSHDSDETGLPTHPGDDAAGAASLRAALAREMSTRLAGKPVVVVVTVRASRHVAPDLRGARRLERRVALPDLDDATHGRVFIELCTDVQFEAAVVGQPNKVGAVVRRRGLRSRLDFAQALRRLVWQERRTASLRDLIECDVYGTGEEDLGAVSPSAQWSVAVHEAGHALVAYLASDRQHVPAYCSIGSRRESAGLVMPSYDVIQRSERGEDSYADNLMRLRVLLAGRCAEHVVLGPDQISAGGAGSDLERASRLAMKMLGSLGLPQSAGDDADLAGNLLVVIGNAADCEVDYCATKARSLLRDQYLQVLGLLRANRNLLLKLASRLTKQSVLMQDELGAIMAESPGASVSPTNSGQTLVKVA